MTRDQIRQAVMDTPYQPLFLLSEVLQLRTWDCAAGIESDSELVVLAERLLAEAKKLV